MTAPLRLGIAGANVERGWARDAHIPALKKLPGLSVHAVSARTQDIADAAGSAFGAARAFNDSLALARDPEVDIVVVTVKVPEHRTIVLAALEAGKHVYCEWPLARDLPEAKELAGAARQAGAHVAIGLQGASAPAVRHAAQLVRDGCIGKPLALRVLSSTAGWGTIAPPHYAYLQDKRNGATLASIAGGHTLAMIEEVAGAYASVAARNSILQEHVRIAGTDETVSRTCPDHMLILGEHENGCVSNAEITGGESRPLQFELRGSDGTLEIRGHHAGGYQCGALSVYCSGKHEEDAHFPFQGLEGNPLNVGQLWSRFEQDIRSGTRTVPDFDRAVRLHRLLDCIDSASEEKRTLKVIHGETGS
ncbi:MAG: Gfo/Idh/MocA family oxidoreductase [Novosphingobium sp.]|nr:Gfo/Idh/MocA family oxidoreductase [Novosphingobium sp.]